MVLECLPLVDVPGIEPGSETASWIASTCVASWYAAPGDLLALKKDSESSCQKFRALAVSWGAG